MDNSVSALDHKNRLMLSLGAIGIIFPVFRTGLRPRNRNNHRVLESGLHRDI